MRDKPIAGTLRFWVRNDKALVSGEVPIHLIYSIKGQRKYYNTGIKIYPEQWNEDANRITSFSHSIGKELYNLKAIDIPNKNDTQRDNAILSEILKNIREIETRFNLDKIPFSSEMVIKMLSNKIGQSTKKEAPKNELFDFMDTYITDNENSRAKGSISVYKRLRKRIKEFEIKENCKVTFENIDYDFFRKFNTFLSNDCNMNNTTVSKMLSTVKTFLSYAKKYGFNVSDKYKDFKIERQEMEVIALTQIEFDLIYNKDLSHEKRLEQVRDVFIFSCVTGMRFSDLSQLNRSQIKKNYITQTVTKTKAKLKIPLNKYSREIIEKYKDCPKPLPVISNQKSNAYLHELCEMAGIDDAIEIVRFKGAERIIKVFPKYELITFHVGRKTFCTLSLEKGMNAEQVMSISGHKDYKSFQRYVNISEDNKTTAMQKAWD